MLSEHTRRRVVRGVAVVAPGPSPSILRSDREAVLQPTPSDPPAVEQESLLGQKLKELLAPDLASLTFGQFLGMVLSGVSLGESQAPFRDHDSDCANGLHSAG